MRKSYYPSLRTAFSVSSALFVVLTLVVASTTIASTDLIAERAAALSAIVNRVDYADDLEVDLLLYNSAADASTQTDRAIRLVDDLDKARSAESGNRGVFRLAERAVRSYMAAPDDTTLTDAYERIEKLVQSDHRQADALVHDANRERSRARAAALIISMVLVLGTIAILVWLRVAALHPILELNRSLKSFAAGDHAAPAPQGGAQELREISASYESLAQTLRGQQQEQIAFLGGVAHDLRNPLSALRMATAAVALGKRATEEQLRTMLAMASRQIDRLDRMVGDLLDVNRLEAGQLDLRLAIVDLQKVVEETVALLQRANADREILVERPAGPCFVRADGWRLEQVLMNLLSNAVKYSPDGASVEVHVSRDGNEVKAAVRDRGPGITEEEKRLLFRPYQRIGARRRSVPGTGLGLYFAYRIVAAHGGRIEVADAPEQGTIFSFHLPAAPIQMPDRDIPRDSLNASV